VPFTVLYIDDDPASTALMREVVAIVPCCLFLASTRGDIGIELALAHKPDLIILDIRLPDTTGYQVLRRLRAMAETAHIPVFALSADARPQDIARGRAEGFGRYMTKPFAMTEMLRLLGAAAASAGCLTGTRSECNDQRH
jgi:CheY-like chemotaxis protein